MDEVGPASAGSSYQGGGGSESTPGAEVAASSDLDLARPGLSEESDLDPAHPAVPDSTDLDATRPPSSEPTALDTAATPPEASTANAALAVLALALAGLGQYFLVHEQAFSLALAAFLMGGAAFVWLAARDGGRRVAFLGPIPDEADSDEASTRAGRWWAGWRGILLAPVAALRGLPRAVAAAPLRSAAILLSLAITAAIFAMLVLRKDALVPYWDLFGLWLGAIGLYLLVLLRPQRFFGRGRLAAELRLQRWALIDAGLLLLFALLLRVPGLAAWPDVLSGDEGTVGNIARDVMVSGLGNVFGTSWANSNLNYYTLGISLRALADPIIGLRLPGALGGALAVPATYLAGRQLFGRPVGLIAGVLLAASHMHIHLSRIPFFHAWDALTAAVATFGLARGLARRDPAWMAVGGVALGLAQYGYVGGRLIDLVALAFFGLLVLTSPRFIRDRLGGLVAMAGAALIVATPMIYWAIFRPGDYMARLNSVGFLQTGALAQRAEETQVAAWLLVANQWRDAWMAVVAYPASMFYNARIAMLDSLWAAFLVLGFTVALWRWRDWRMLLLALQILGGLALLAFAVQPGITVYRSSGILVACAILAGLALVVLVEAGLDGLDVGRRVPWGVALIIVVTIAGYNMAYYFGDHLPNCRYMDAATGSASIVANFIRQRAGTDTVFALTEADFRLEAYPSVLFLTRREPRFLKDLPPEIPAPGTEGSAKHIYLIAQDAPDLHDLVGQVRPAWVIVSPGSQAALEALVADRPGGERVALTRCGKPVAEAYRLP